MKVLDRKHAVSMGLRVSVVFLAAVVSVFMVAYYVLPQNFQNL